MPLPHSAWLLSGNGSIERVGEKREEVGMGWKGTRESGGRGGGVAVGGRGAGLLRALRGGSSSKTFNS